MVSQDTSLVTALPREVEVAAEEAVVVAVGVVTVITVKSLDIWHEIALKEGGTTEVAVVVAAAADGNAITVMRWVICPESVHRKDKEEEEVTKPTTISQLGLG